MPSSSLSKDAGLRSRASKVVPGGMWGHLNAANLPEGYPQFYASGDGATLVDVDGRRFIDFMCAWGPNFLGYRHPEVDDAAARQLLAGDCLNGPGAVMVELAELIVDTIAAADWVQFQKNGTDATTSCVTIARAGTRKRKVLLAQGAYHGAVPWCSPSILGVTAEDRAHLDLLQLQRSREPARSGKGRRGRSRRDCRLCVPARFRQGPGIADPGVRGNGTLHLRRALRGPDHRRGARRFPPRSGRKLGVSRSPTRISRPGARPSPTAIRSPRITGADWLRNAASQVFLTGSFWCGAAAMAAAIATLTIARRDDVIRHMSQMGQLSAGRACRTRRQGRLHAAADRAGADADGPVRG